ALTLRVGGKNIDGAFGPHDSGIGVVRTGRGRGLVTAGIRGGGSELVLVVRVCAFESATDDAFGRGRPRKFVHRRAIVIAVTLRALQDGRHRNTPCADVRTRRLPSKLRVQI